MQSILSARHSIMENIALLVLLSAAIVGVFGRPAQEDGGECDVSGSSRIECGWLGIGGHTCLKRGCCWDSSDRNAKFCFVKKGQQLLEGHCPVAPSERHECGYYGITREQCVNRTCCWDDSVYNAKWCFHKPDNDGTVHGRILAINEAINKKRMEEAANPESLIGKIGSGNTNEVKPLQLYEGDIVLDYELIAILNATRNRRFKRNAVRYRGRLWVSRRIPYKVPYNMRHITSNLNIAINEFHKHTCLRFVPYRGQQNYITFSTDDGCSSTIGRKHWPPGPQTISLGNNCNNPPVILHEIMHAIGFWHEQSRPDRDKFVKINYENIDKANRDQFTKLDWRDMDDLGKDYDFQSIMHYGRYTFSKNGKPTIQAIHNPNLEFGNKANRLSVKDIIEINTLYDCKTTYYGWTRWSSFTPCDKKCRKSRERYCYHSGNIKMCGGNVNMYGIERQKVDCPRCPEPMDGHWGNWGRWTSCSATCSDGAKKRTRVCNNPAPAHGGKYCPGSSTEEVLCSIKRCHLDQDDTDFENYRMGIWSNVKGDDFDWTRHKGFTKTMNTGPMRDHTSGNGYYLYIESSMPRRPGNKARLVTPWMPYVPGGQCVKFAYTMYGSTTGVLSIMLELEKRAVKWFIFYKKGNQGEGWKAGIGNIDPPTSLRYRLTFEASIGKQTGYSDTAIDDVYIDPGLCKCQDDYESCKKWAKAEECYKNSDWMKKHCKRSCQQCSCTDSDPVRCPGWSSKGYCASNPDYMLVKCTKSCHVCRCHDNNVDCIKWSNQGECTRNPTYMLVNCKRSCKRCL